jgi:transcriptional regulator with XRE-family HTH domain
LVNISDRISQVVKESGLTKTAFAKRINISQPYLSQLCGGGYTPSDRTIADISREFHVRREWLETGEGPMRLPEPHADMAYLDALLSGDDAETIRFIKKFLRTYTALPTEDQRVIDNLIHTLLDEK